MNSLSIILTKKILMAAPTGWLLVSNCMKSPRQSVLELRLAASIPGREAQWRRIVAARANHRLCRVFQTQAEYHTWLSTIVLTKVP